VIQTEQRSVLWDEEAERSVLGAVLLDPDLAEIVFSTAPPDSFYDQRHKIIASTMVSLLADGAPIDLTLLCGKLNDTHQIDAAGGWIYIAQLEQNVFATAAAPEYAERIARKSGERALVKLQQGTLDILRNGGGLDAAAQFNKAGLDEILSNAAGISNSDPWRMYMVEDALEDRPAPTMIIDGVFRLPSLNMVFGASGSHKTNLLLDACMCIAKGKDWLEPLPKYPELSPYRVHPCPVAWYNADTPTDDLLDRIAAAARAHDLRAADPFFTWSFPTPFLNATSAQQLVSLERRLVRYGIKLAIIDCLQTIRGALDENSAEMGEVMAGLRRVTEAANCTIVLIHHVNKEGGFRGSTAIENLIDNSLLVERPSREKDEIIVKPEKQRGCPIRPFSATYAYDHKPGTKQLYSGKFFQISKDAQEGGDIEETIFSIIYANPGINKSEIQHHLTAGGNNASRWFFDRAISRLIATKRIVESGGPKNSKTYTASRTSR
jgi:hypothetical protein